MKSLSTLLLLTTVTLLATSAADDGTAILALAKSFTPPPSDWSTTTSTGFCKWSGVQCTSDLRVTSISLADTSLSGVIAPEISTLTKLKSVALQRNKLTGKIPSFAKLSFLREICMDENLFVGVEIGAFSGLTSLRILSLSGNKNMNAWTFPRELVDSTASLTTINLENTNIYGVLPDVFDSLASLRNLRLSYNNITGVLPPSLAKSSIQNLCINDQLVGMSGTIQVLSSMTSLSHAWLQKNHFSGPIPDLSESNNLFDLQLRDNQLTGTIPPSLLSLGSLKNISLDNNRFQGSFPSSPREIKVSADNNNLCASAKSGQSCSPHFMRLLNSGVSFSNSSGGGNRAPVIVGVIVVAVLVFLALIGFGIYKFLTKGNYRKSNRSDLENPRGGESSNGANSVSALNNPSSVPNNFHDPNPREIIRDDVSLNGGGGECSDGQGANSVSALNNPSSSVADNSWERNVREGRIDTIPMAVLSAATKDFSKTLGKGGFGEVYYGELPDADKRKVAVKKMNRSAMDDKEAADFEAEIAVLLKAKHKNLVALLGYSVNKNERFLIYEYMPQGHLGKHLFEWRELGDSPLTWKQRVNIALDVAHGLDYFHSLAQQCFIHRDLKPDNILIGDDMRAKIADFGFVKNVADGKYSVLTRVAGTFGYLAPEYTLYGKVSPKVDVYSFGVILMELLTGRKVLDYTLPVERIQLVIWFRKIIPNREKIREARDKTLEVDDETMESIYIVAELAGHCTSREPQHRPEMGHVVNVLIPLADKWTPSCHEEEESFQIDGIKSLPQLVNRWDWEDKGSYSDKQEPGMDHAVNMLDPLVEKCKSSCQGEEEIPRTVADRVVALRKQLESKAYTGSIEIDPEIYEALRRQVVSESYPEISILEIDADTFEALWNQLILETNADSSVADTVSEAETPLDADANTVSDKQRLDMDHAAYKMLAQYLARYDDMSCEEKEKILGSDPEVIEALWREIVLWSRKITKRKQLVSKKQRRAKDCAANVLATEKRKPSCQEEEENVGIDASMSVPEAQGRLLVSDTDSFSDMYIDTLADTLSDTDTL